MAFLIVRVGGTFDSLKPRLGDYDDWFRRALGLSEQEAPDVAPMDGEPLPDANSELDGIVVTGSAAMVSDREPWSETTARWLAAQAERQVPLLGVCYGHQLVAHGLGGVVDRNPHGRQIGSVAVTLGAQANSDPLLSALAAEHTQQVSHVQSVLKPPRGAEVMGTTPRDPHHVLRFGPRAWGVQFHPEFDAEIVRAYITERRDRIAQEGQDPDALIAGVQSSDAGSLLLRRFAELCRGWRS